MNVRSFYTKLTHWEYWPFGVVYFPIILYYLWLSTKARSFFFFSASNPSIENGGMLGESKQAILTLIPKKYLPKTLFFLKNSFPTAILESLKLSEMTFPLIIKPDVGERGRGVEKLENEAALYEYLLQNQVDFLLQEFIDYPIELGIFYYKLPFQSLGVVSSIVVKEFLNLKGDGISSLETLMNKDSRARFQIDRLKSSLNLSHVPKIDERYLLEPIGNHCRGTKFINGNHYIDESLCKTFTAISDQLPGFNFGRYDLKCTSIEDLKKGEGIKIMELNGAGAEPAHIYDPSLSLLNAWKVLAFHWKILYTISVHNHRVGIPYLSFTEAVRSYKNQHKP